MSDLQHVFSAIAYVENFPLKDLAPSFPEARRSPRELVWEPHSGGTVYLFPFGAVVFHNVGPEARKAELSRIAAARPGPHPSQVASEELVVRVEAGARQDLENGVLVVDQLSNERAGIIALTVAQSAAMDYYETIVDQMFVETDKLSERLEKKGTMPMRTRPVVRFIGAALGTRNEVLSILHLLDKPEAIWDDPGAERIHEKLRLEFDLVDRFEALEHKLKSVEDVLEIITDVARDRRLFLLEATVVLLILIEIIMGLVRH